MNSEQLTIRTALAYGLKALHATDSPALDTRLLLEHVLEVDHAYLIAHDEQAVRQEDAEAYRQLLRRAALGEPIPYLTGRAPFFGRDFLVTSSVLIPRPETELLVERALSWLREWERKETAASARPKVVDVGTGSGCIAVTLALETSGAQIAAVDISPAALEIARRNAARYGVVDRMVFHLGSLLSPIDDSPDLIVANLPYVADHEWTALADGIKWYEPDVALRGGQDGLEVIRQLLGQAVKRLAPGGAVLIEIGWQQGTAAQDLARHFFPEALVEILADYGGQDRLMVIQTTE